MDFNTRIVDFNLKDLPDSMLVFALINVCEAVRNRMYFNAKRNVRTWLYVEEMQSLFAYPTVLNYFSRFSNEGRKFGLLLTGITQNAVAMLNNEAAQNIVLNADLHHAAQAVPARPHALGGTAEPFRAGGGVHRRVRRGR